MKLDRTEVTMWGCASYWQRTLPLKPSRAHSRWSQDSWKLSLRVCSLVRSVSRSVSLRDVHRAVAAETNGFDQGEGA